MTAPESGLLKHLASVGLRNVKTPSWNLLPADLIEHAVRRGEGRLAGNGAFLVETGKYTGRSPNDRFIVEEGASVDQVGWGSVNKPISPAHFDGLHQQVCAYFENREFYVQDCFSGADPDYRLPIRVVTERAYHSLFARTLFLPANNATPDAHQPEFTVIHAPSLLANPERDGTHSEAFVLLALERGLIIIGGTSYAGEIKKSIFSVMNYVLPARGVLGMHCSANLADDGSCALFFGLSGTGKTTLSADPERRLIGDDEHGWSDSGVFNFEGGCYAKCIRLSHETEPQIWEAIRFGSLVENVIMDPATRALDYDDGTLTENTRCTYPVTYIPNAELAGRGGHPNHIVFLTCDAFGVLPPVSRLTPEQAMYHFMSGYTAKLAGTERGVNEPEATFSSCFGEPFLPRPAAEYARMLGERIERHGSSCWLINTGWSGGAFGVGERISLPYTRAIVNAALRGDLDGVPMTEHPIFRLQMPTACPGVPSKILNPRQTWSDPAAYDRTAADLAERFRVNFERFEGVAEAIAEAAPVLA